MNQFRLLVLTTVKLGENLRRRLCCLQQARDGLGRHRLVKQFHLDRQRSLRFRQWDDDSDFVASAGFGIEIRVLLRPATNGHWAAFVPAAAKPLGGMRLSLK